MELWMNLALALALLSLGYGCLAYPLTGKKPDPFALFRWGGRHLVNGVGGLCRGVSDLFRGWGRGLERVSRRSNLSFLGWVPVAMGAVVFLVLGIVFSIPGSVLRIRKK